MKLRNTFWSWQFTQGGFRLIGKYNYSISPVPWEGLETHIMKYDLITDRRRCSNRSCHGSSSGTPSLTERMTYFRSRKCNTSGVFRIPRPQIFVKSFVLFVFTDVVRTPVDIFTKEVEQSRIFGVYLLTSCPSTRNLHQNVMKRSYMIYTLQPVK